jgi:hypothetical protein
VQTANTKWQRYEQALLSAMGYAPIELSKATSAYQLLIIPSFHKPCCLRISLAEQDGELSFRLLINGANDLFQAVWQEKTEQEALFAYSAELACLDDGSYLPADQVATIRQRLLALEPMTLADIDLAARDGVSIRCDCYDQNTRHTFRMRSPTQDEAARYTGLFSLFLELAQAHFPHPQIQAHLAALHRYVS